VWWAISPWKIRASPGFRMMGITYVPIRRFADIPIADNCCMPQCQPILIDTDYKPMPPIQVIK